MKNDEDALRVPLKSRGKNNTSSLVRRIVLRRETGILGALIVLIVVFSIFSRQFLTVSNLLTIANQISMVLIIGIGMTIVIILGGIDLSVGYVAALAGMITAGLLSAQVDTSLAIVIGLGIGAVFGLVNGVLIAKVGITDFIVTLATMLVAHGFIFAYSGGRSIFKNIPDSFLFIGQGRIFGIPVPIFLAVIIFFIGHMLLTKMRLGRYIYATGGNKEAARLSGINIDGIRIIGYTISGITAAMAGIIMASRLGSGQPTAGDTFLFDVVGAVVLGGTALSGGEGTVVGTAIGVVIIGAISNGLTQLGVSYYFQEVIKGLIIILAVSYNAIKMKRSR